VTRSTIASAAALALACLGALPCRAQGRLSEKAVVAQTVKSTTITVEYYRPVARGRTLFGDSGVVERGRIWALGANWATTLEVDHDIFVEGKPLPKGRYSLWALVDRDVWTLSFHRTWHLFHMARPDSTDEQLRLTVRPDSAAPTEILTFDFPEIQGGETTLRMRWGRLAIPLHLTMIAPPLKLLTDRAERARYLGHYDLEVKGGSGEGDTHVLLDVAEVSDTLHWRDTTNPFAPLRDFMLNPAGPDNEFTRALRSADGQYWTDADLAVVFQLVSGRAEGFELQRDGTVVSRAKRVH